MASPNPIESQLAQLRESFAVRLPSRAEEVERAWDAAVQSNWSQDAVKVLHRAAHTLAGSSATFGFMEVSQAARAMEKFAQRVSEDGEPVGAGQSEEGYLLLGALKDLVAPLQNPAPDPHDEWDMERTSRQRKTKPTD